MFLVALVAYWILLGGTEAGETVGWVRALNAALAGIAIVLMLRELPKGSDRIDALAVLPLLALVAAALFGVFPRLSLDYAMAGIGWFATFFLGRRALARPETMRLSLDMLGVIGIVLSVVMGLLWGSVWFRWFQASGFDIWPPLNADLPTVVFWHPHVVALLVALLAPAQLELWRHRQLRPVIVVALGAAGFVTLASGYRTLWAASAVALVLLLLRKRASGGKPIHLHRGIIGLVGACAGAVGLVVAAGLGGPLVDRLFTLSTIGARIQIWGAALQEWVRGPVFGLGPGSFAGALPLTNYGQTNRFLPRHADNLVVQLLAEGGVVLAVALLPLAIAVLRRAVDDHLRPFFWILAVFLLASFTDNPTAFGDLCALVVFASAAATRRSPTTFPATQRSLPAWPSAAAFGVLTAVFSILSAASITYDVGVARATSGALMEAATWLRAATVMDPATPLYRRELGIVEVASGDRAQSLRDLAVARRLAPLDRITYQALATAQADLSPQAALETAQAALRLEPASPLARLLVAVLNQKAGDSGKARASAAEALATNPWLAANAEWYGMVSHIDDNLYSKAMEEADRLARDPPGGSYVHAMLSAMAGEPEGADNVGPASLRSTLSAWRALLDCQLDDADAIIAKAAADEGDGLTYWLVRLAIERALGHDRTNELVLTSLAFGYSGDQFVSDVRETAFDPPFDRRVYKRASLSGIGGLLAVPDARSGRRLWIVDPFAAARMAAPHSALAKCR